MNQKVTLPKSVCDTLDIIKKETVGFSHFKIVDALINKTTNHSDHEFFTQSNADILFKALVFGYVPEKTNEEMLKQYLSEFIPRGDKWKTAKKVLAIHDIHYDWL